MSDINWTDDPDLAKWDSDVVWVYDVPRHLGSVTKLREVNGKLIADTESGASLIVPASGFYK